MLQQLPTATKSLGYKTGTVEQFAPKCQVILIGIPSQLLYLMGNLSNLL